QAIPPGEPATAHRFYSYPVTFRAATSYPIYERSWGLTRGFSRKEQAALDAALDIPDREPCHQIGGYPTAIQGDFMENECQEAWNRDLGLSSDADSKAHSSAPLPGSEDWRLLFQLDSDARMGSNWGDA